MRIPSKYKIWRYPLLLRLKYCLRHLFSSNRACITYWINSNTFIWDTCLKPYNWGDFVNVKLAELISGKTIIPSRYYASAPKISMMGSILPWSMDKNTIVWGSGCLDSNSPLWNNLEKPILVLAVRGPLTRQILIQHGIDCPEVYGDPALLFPKYYYPTVDKKYKYGIILHVSTEVSNMILEELKFIYGDSILIIDPKRFSKWNEFIDSILSCENIVSSSLHGIIVSDAYKIPNVWISVTNQEHPDNNLKFKDYYLSVGKTISSPINYKDKTLIEEKLKDWTEPIVDIDKLLDVCPLI